MRLSRSTVIFITVIIVLSMLLANVVNLLSTDEKQEPKDFFAYQPNRLEMTDKSNHLLWFLQISDIHISIFRDPLRRSELKEFCDVTVSIIKPPVVLASGDLTDAKTSDNIGSQQVKEEWLEYRNILTDCKVLDKTTWLDLRGNHDNFNVINLQSKENYYTNYSIQGKLHPRSYFHQIKKGDATYSFIAIDACLEPGPRRPFNFVGILDSAEITLINSMVKKIEASGSNYTVWYGHFPTSCILADYKGGVRKLIGQHKHGLVYLCGHLHQLGGIVPKMYTLQQAGFLELELGDWKDNRMFRLLAIDHGLFSFVDVRHRDWPIVLITNPKHALFHIPYKENLDIIKESSHIRVLVFSVAVIESVEVRIDDAEWVRCRNADGPLFVAPWEPQKYLDGIHNIQVFVRDMEGREKHVTNPFSLDGTKLSFDILPRIALMTNASTMFKLMYGVFLLISIIPLFILKMLHVLIKGGKMAKIKLRNGCCSNLIIKLWVLVTVGRIFWPLVLYPIYLSFGPWSVGYIVENHLGAIFAWGIVVNGSFLPGSFTYAYGFIQFFTFQIPLTLSLANAMYYRFKSYVAQSKIPCTIWQNLSFHLPFIIIVCLQLVMAYFFWLAYGTVAFLIGPLRTWSVIIAIILWRQILVFPDDCLREAALMWEVQVKRELKSGALTT